MWPAPVWQVKALRPRAVPARTRSVGFLLERVAPSEASPGTVPGAMGVRGDLDQPPAPFPALEPMIRREVQPRLGGLVPRSARSPRRPRKRARIYDRSCVSVYPRPCGRRCDSERSIAGKQQSWRTENQGCSVYLVGSSSSGSGHRGFRSTFSTERDTAGASPASGPARSSRADKCAPMSLAMPLSGA